MAIHPVDVQIQQGLSASKDPKEAARQEGQEETAQYQFAAHHVLGPWEDVHNFQKSNTIGPFSYSFSYYYRRVFLTRRRKCISGRASASHDQIKQFTSGSQLRRKLTMPMPT
jgi:hypothetical protein